MEKLDIIKKINAVIERSRKDRELLLGYPSTQFMDFSPLYPLLESLLNNIGDPFHSSKAYRLNTHDLEKEVVKWFVSLMKGSMSEIWGYVTSGGTEGNMYGLYLARERFPDGIVYYSEDTHYSVHKMLHLVKSDSHRVLSQPCGEINYDDFSEKVEKNKDKPVVVFANIGTTMRGAIDNLDIIKKVLKEKSITDFYIHADAALSGLILPFVNDPQPFNFSSDVHSISISGHKLPGIPIPCGVVLAHRSLVDGVMRDVEYIGNTDATLLGSRSGLAASFLWYVIQILEKEGFLKMVQKCFEVKEYALSLFQERNIPAWCNKNSITIVFPRCHKGLVEKWQLATQQDEAHLIVMPHVTKETIDLFFEDLDIYSCL